MAEGQNTSLKRALSNQRQIIQRLNEELEDEREASASGANEALTMILRIQKEKAEEKREASQYRKMTEAKLQYAEESLALFEELLYAKDVEIESLKHKVQSYKKILQYARHNDNIQFPNSTFLQRTGSCIQIKRQTSEITLCHEDGSLLSEIDTIWRDIDKESSFDLKPQNELHLRSSTGKRFLRSKSTGVYLHEHLAGIPESRDSTPVLKELLTDFRPNYVVPIEFEKLKYQVQELAGDVRCMKQAEMLKENEQISLLKSIYEQLKSIHSYIKGTKPRKFGPKDEVMLVYLKEAIPSLWI